MSDQEKPSRSVDSGPSLSDFRSSIDQEPLDANEPSFWDKLGKMGFFDVAMKLGTVTLSVLLFLVVIWVMGRFYTPRVSNALNGNPELAEEITPTAQVVLPEMVFIEGGLPGGVSKQASLHTILPSRGRTAMEGYIVQAGDTLFSIAERFGLQPETILWGNRYTLGEDPHTIFPGQTLNILPMDGVIHKWSAGEGLNGVASFYQVTPEDIINYEANDLSMATIGDFADPNIPEGKMLIIPGGKGVFTDWRTPRITRSDPARASYVGAGACTGAYEGISGTLNFRWPANERYLSGYDYSPASNHFGIDIAGETGDPIYATDSGVVVYAGWNDWGYGEMVVIDHGFGWQSLYAHLSVINVGCGQEVYAGDVIGLMGSTGNSSGSHLHFELRSDEYGRVNPWDMLQ
jgi:hypothetical protein